VPIHAAQNQLSHCATATMLSTARFPKQPGQGTDCCQEVARRWGRRLKSSELGMPGNNVISARPTSPGTQLIHPSWLPKHLHCSG
jgi:hypothetical protein